MRAPSDTCRSFSGVFKRVSDAVVMSELLQRKRGTSNSMTSTIVQVMGCPRCPLYLRDSPQLRVAPSVGQSRSECRLDLSPVGIRLLTLPPAKRLSVLLPERSNRCDQPFCAFGGHHKGWLSPDRVDSNATSRRSSAHRRPRV